MATLVGFPTADSDPETFDRVSEILSHSQGSEIEFNQFYLTVKLK